VVEGTGPRVSLGEEIGREVEDLLDGGRNGGVFELGGVRGPEGAADDGALLDPRRDHDGGHPDAEAVELEEEGRRAPDAVGAGHAGGGRGDVVVEATVLVVGDDEQRLVPLRAGPERLVHVLDETLPVGDVVRRVVVVGGGPREVEVPGLDDGERREDAASGVFLEGGVVAVEGAGGVAERAEAAVEEHGGDGLEVDGEVVAVGGEGLEDCALRVAEEEVELVVRDGAAGGGRVEEQPVGLRGPRDGGEPAVEDGELGRECGEDREEGGAEGAHHGGGEDRVDGERAADEARHGGLRLRSGGGDVAEHLLQDVLEGVARVVGDDEVGVGGHADGGCGVGIGVALRAVEPVDGEAQQAAHPAQHVVERPVLQRQHHHVLYGAGAAGAGGIGPAVGGEEEQEQEEERQRTAARRCGCHVRYGACSTKWQPCSCGSKKMEPARKVGMGWRPLAAFARSPFSVSSAMDASKRL
jgi:hypothetical protein